MISEFAILDVKPGTEKEFLETFTEQAIGVLREAGATDFTIYRSQEKITHFIIFCKWESAAVRIGFAETPLYQKYVGLVGGYLAGPPLVDDFDVVFTEARKP